MTLFEQYSLVIQIIGIIAVVITILYASKQIKISKNIHQETLDWNKKTNTENELNNKHDKEVRHFLFEKFKHHIERGINIIPLAEIQTEIESDINVQLQIHTYLNKYERIARGIKNGLYDKKMVIEAMRYTFVKVFYNYKEYVNYRREISNKNAWINFEKLVFELNEEYKIYINPDTP